MSHGVQMEFSYTYSKSMDMGSDDERTMFSQSTGSSIGSSFSAILNAWNPALSYGPSDYDVRTLDHDQLGSPASLRPRQSAGHASRSRGWTTSSAAGSSPVLAAGPAGFRSA